MVFEDRKRRANEERNGNKNKKMDIYLRGSENPKKKTKKKLRQREEGKRKKK